MGGQEIRQTRDVACILELVTPLHKTTQNSSR